MKIMSVTRFAITFSFLLLYKLVEGSKSFSLPRGGGAEMASLLLDECLMALKSLWFGVPVYVIKNAKRS